MFTGVVLSQLHADGLIDLDVPVSTYLGIDSTVTARDLLSHTAGLVADPHEDVVFEWAWEDMSGPLPPPLRPQTRRAGISLINSRESR